MSQLRQVRPINIDGLTPSAPEEDQPIFEWVDPIDLFVDPEYQRNVAKSGDKQIVRIIEKFSWTRFKPPICTFANVDGKDVLKVLDGQHTAIGAASNPNVGKIPVMIVVAPEVKTQAESFIGHNTDRVAVSHMQLHHAALAAQNENALLLERVCKAAGVKLLVTPPWNGVFQPGETQAVVAINGLIIRKKPIPAKRVLEILVNAELAPITSAQIKAAEFLRFDEHHAPNITDGALSAAIAGTFHIDEKEAKMLMVSHNTSFWRALATTWYKKTKKRRMPAGGAA